MGDPDLDLDLDLDLDPALEARARVREGLAAREAERALLMQALMGGPNDFFDMAEEMQLAMAISMSLQDANGAGAAPAARAPPPGRYPPLASSPPFQPLRPAAAAGGQAEGMLAGLGPLAFLSGLSMRQPGGQLLFGSRGGGGASPLEALLLRQAGGGGGGGGFGAAMLGRGRGGAGAGTHGGADGGGLALGPGGSLVDLSYEGLLQLEDVKVPTPAHVIKSLPRSLFTKHGSSCDQGPCSICQVDYEEAESLAWLPCMHSFHSDCISQWLGTYSKKCPVCKAEVC